MNFQEAFVKMLEGEKVRIADWDDEFFVEVVNRIIVDERGCNWLPAKWQVSEEWGIWNHKQVDITITMNGEKVDPKSISKETWENLRK